MFAGLYWEPNQRTLPHGDTNCSVAWQINPGEAGGATTLDVQECFPDNQTDSDDSISFNHREICFLPLCFVFFWLKGVAMSHEKSGGRHWIVSMILMILFISLSPLRGEDPAPPDGPAGDSSETLVPISKWFLGRSMFIFNNLETATLHAREDAWLQFEEHQEQMMSSYEIVEVTIDEDRMYPYFPYNPPVHIPELGGWYVVWDLRVTYWVRDSPLNTY